MSGNPPSTKQGLYVIGERNNPKNCLGTSVYAEWDGYAICLTTENGRPDDPSNRIYLEPAVLDGLDLFRQAYMGFKPIVFWGAADEYETRAAELYALGICTHPRRHGHGADAKICRPCFLANVAAELRRAGKEL
jgi:hypothetical protein